MPKLTLKTIHQRLLNLPNDQEQALFIKVNHPTAMGGGLFEITCIDFHTYVAYLWDAHYQGGIWIAQGGVSVNPIYQGDLDGLMAIISRYRR